MAGRKTHQALTREILLAVGACCGLKCRECPYSPKWTKGETNIMKSTALNQIEIEKEKVQELEDGLVNKKNWWDDIQSIDEPYPHIPETQILAVMPEELKPEWEDFIRGQTGLLLTNEDGSYGSGIYPWDFERFTSKLKRGLPTRDTAAEWD